MDRIRVTNTIPIRLAKLGINAEPILRQARLPQNLFQQDHAFITTDQWFALWRGLVEQVSDPGFGLHIAGSAQGEPYDPLQITALSAASFHAALMKIARYKRIFSSEEIKITQHGQLWGIEMLWLASQESPPNLLIDITMSHLLDIGKLGTGKKLYPERLRLKRPEQHRALYEDFFQCPIEFAAERNLIFFSDATMAQRFSTANPVLLALIEPQLELDLRERMAKPGFIEEVKQLLRVRIAGQVPSAPEVADELSMSTRTLQRRLADEGVQFKHLLEQVRHAMAKEYLLVSALDLSQIAFLLGYKEASSFHRAFHSWEGLPPGQWRAAQR